MLFRVALGNIFICIFICTFTFTCSIICSWFLFGRITIATYHTPLFL